MNKICTSCKIEKPLDQFPKNRSLSDGHTKACRSCTHLRVNARNRTKATNKIAKTLEKNLLSYTDPSELWVDFPTDDRFEISSNGRVRNKSLYKLLKPSSSGGGYLLFVRYRDGVFSGAYIHHAVAKAFIGDRPEGYTVSHLDGNKLNNCVENLTYETLTDNMARKIEHGTHYVGEQNKASKLTELEVLEIRNLYQSTNTSHVKLAKLYNVAHSTIARILNNTCWSHV